MTTKATTGGDEPSALSFTTRLQRRLVCGTFGGMCLAVVGHPFETIKVRMQAADPPFTSVKSCADTIFSESGPRGFFRGVSLPMATWGVTNACLFSFQHASKQFLQHMFGIERYLSPAQVDAASGILTAFPFVAVLTPMELIKTRIQTCHSQQGVVTVRSVFFDTYQNEGLRAFWRGYSATVSMRCIGLPAYFGGYNAVKNWGMEGTAEGTPVPGRIAAGGGVVGGALFWAVSFPADVIKTRMQVASAQSKKLNVLGVIKGLYVEGGVRAFYRGYVPCLARSAPANAAMFFGFEKAAAVFFDGKV